MERKPLQHPDSSVADPTRRRMLTAAGVLGLLSGPAVTWLVQEVDAGALRLRWSRERVAVGGVVTLRIERGRLPAGAPVELRVWARDLVNPDVPARLVAQHRLTVPQRATRIAFEPPYPYLRLQDAQLRFLAEAAGALSPPLCMNVRGYRFSC